MGWIKKMFDHSAKIVDEEQIASMSLQELLNMLERDCISLKSGNRIVAQVLIRMHHQQERLIKEFSKTDKDSHPAC